jgi:prephenate dehydrogenase
MSVFSTPSLALARETQSIDMRVGTLAIIGVGLIGGSFALALKRRGLVDKVIGVGRGEANIRRALALGVIDQAETSVAQAAAAADVVLLAVPVMQIGAVLVQVARAYHPGLLVTDAGSTKQDFIDCARRVLPAAALQGTVPGHPIAGAELTGVDAATDSLFEGRNVVLTPMSESTVSAVDMIAALWGGCGARVSRMSAARHDEIFAAVSHLPHVLAFALVNAMALREDAADTFAYAGAGFRDFTRIAASSAEMWRDICMTNRDNLVQQIDAFAQELWKMREGIRRGNAALVEESFATARASRKRLLPKRGSGSA